MAEQNQIGAVTLLLFSWGDHEKSNKHYTPKKKVTSQRSGVGDKRTGLGRHR